MSQTETHVGKLRKVDLRGLDIEQWCEATCKELGITELSSYNRSWKEQFMDISGYEKYFSIGDEIWEAFDHIQGGDEDDIYHMKKNEDGTITFVMRFYNGGTCLSECIEEGLEKIKES
jgi:hypothetical protein